MRTHHFFLVNSLFLTGVLVSPVGSAVEHDISGKLRVRHSTVDSDLADGYNTTALLRFSLHSEWASPWQSTVEVDAVTQVLPSQYNDGVDRNNHAFIPDSTGVFLKQLSVSYEQGNVSLRLGRQRLNWDNQRFLGSESFWQNDQVFDAFSSRYELASASELHYVYLHNQHRITGEGASSGLNADLDGSHRHQSHLLRFHWRDWDYQIINAYYLKLDDKKNASVNSDTAAISYEYERRLGSIKPFIKASIAQQHRDTSAENTNLYYRQLHAGMNIQRWQLRAQREVLSSNGVEVFITPLASLHDFHGWADKWWNMPAKGIVDDSLRLLWRGKPLRLDLRWHRYKSHDGGIDWGDEINLDLLYKKGKNQRWLLRLADYQRGAQTPARFADEMRAYVSFQWEF